MPAKNPIDHAVYCLRQGGVIAYPTEAVFGFGCDPFNIDAVTRLMELKQRPFQAGFILVAANWEQVEPLTEPIPPAQQAQVIASWPGPVTWIFPCPPTVPTWLRGNHTGIALRISAHPIIQQLCLSFGGPIVSTSANVHGHPPARDFHTVQLLFENKVDFIVPGKVGSEQNPSRIRDAITGVYLR